MKYPLKSSKKEIRLSLNNSFSTLKKNLTKREFLLLTKPQRFQNNSIDKYSQNGKFTSSRKETHNKIIQRNFKDKRTIDKKDPDFYILGGIAGSGKTTTLVRKIPERTVVIANDDFKQDLSKFDKSPIKRFPLAHSQFFHEEADILVRRSIRKAIKEKRDVTLDGTLRKFSKSQRLVRKFKEEGYDVHLLGTQMKPNQAVENITGRFLSQGRWLPPKIVAKHGNKINKNVWRAKKDTDTHIILDTTNEKQIKVVSKSKDNIRKNFRDP